MSECEVKRWCHFHKLIVPSILQQKKLKIPKKFAKKFENELQDIATITVPDKGIWPVMLTKAHGTSWFHFGWHEFVDQCSIHAGHLLDFRYEGNSNFSVIIYDLVPYKINRVSSSIRITENQDKQYCVLNESEDDDSIEILDGYSPPCPTLNSVRSKKFDEHVVDDSVAGFGSSPASSTLNSFKQHNLSDCMHQNVPCQSYSSLSECIGISRVSLPSHCLPVQCSTIELQSSTNDLTLLVSNKQVRAKNESPEIGEENLLPSGATDVLKMQTQSIRCTNVPFGSSEAESSAGNTTRHFSGEADKDLEKSSRKKQKNVLYSSRTRAITAEERQRVINAAKTFQSNNPFCTIVLRQSYLYRRSCILHLPSCFVEKYLSGHPYATKLVVSDGRKWHVQFFPDGAKLGNGWYHFSQDNNLEEGDVCVFEMIEERGLEMKVHIFRAVENSG